jgi:hypothetical protein
MLADNLLPLYSPTVSKSVIIVKNGTSSELSPTTTSFVQDAPKPKVGVFFVDTHRRFMNYIQIKCSRCKEVTQHNGVDIEIYGDHAPHAMVRILLCTVCSNTSKQTQQWPSAEQNTLPQTD